MTVFDSRDLQARAQNAPVNIGPPSGLWENASAAWESFVRGETSVAVDRGFQDELERLAEDARKITGDKRIRAPSMAPSLDPGESARTVRRQQVSSFFEKLAAINAQHGSDLPADEDSVLRRVAKRAQLAADELANVTARSRGSVSGFLGRLAGAAAASFTDPPILAGTLLAAPFVAQGLAGIAAEAGISLAIEGVAQPLIQRQRAKLGLPHGVERALFAIAAAGVGGAAFGTVGAGIGATFRAAARAGRQASRNPMDEAARGAAFLERADETLAADPFLPFATARREYVASVDEALDALRTGRPVELADASRSVPTRAALAADEAMPKTMRAEPAAELGRAVGAAGKSAILRELDPDLDGQLRAEAARHILRGQRLDEALDVIRERQALDPLRRAFIEASAALAEGASPQRQAAVTRARRRLAGAFADANPHLAREDVVQSRTRTEIDGRTVERVELTLPRDKQGRPVAEPDAVLSEDGRAAFDAFVTGEDAVAQAADVLGRLGVDVSRLTNAAVREQLAALDAAVPPRTATGDVDVARAEAESAIELSDDATDAALRELDADPERVITITDEDGNEIEVQAGAALAELKDDEKALRQLSICITGTGT